MNAAARQRIRLNRHLRAEPGRKRAYRVAKWRGSLDGVLRALYPAQPPVLALAAMAHPFLSLRRI